MYKSHYQDAILDYSDYYQSLRYKLTALVTSMSYLSHPVPMRVQAFQGCFI